MRDDQRGVRDRLLRPKAVWIGTLVSALGVAFASVHMWHTVTQYSNNISAIVYGSGVSLLGSILIVCIGYWLTRRNWDEVNLWRIVAWCGGGVGFHILLGLLLRLHQITHQGDLTDLFSLFVLLMTYGALVGLLLGIYDIQAQEATLRWKQKSQQLDEFASIVSHDLRNPLNVAQGNIELVRETGDQSRLDTAYDALDRMERIIKETLTLARQGTDAMVFEPVPLAQVATESWQMVATDESELRITTDQQILADPDRLRALLENLFQNAVEHNETPVSITVGALEAGGFFVEDNGTGIPPEMREQVFEGGFSTEQDGTGLGLAIVRSAADAHDWSVILTESETGGARFEIRHVDDPE